MVFRDRRHAGRLLAERLADLADRQPIVIALPRGGVPVGFEVARALGTPMDILAVRKIGAPGNPEYGVGAIAEDGTAILDRDSAQRTGLTEELLEETVEREIRELHRRVERYRDGRARADVRGRTVIVVDDGLATGLTCVAAVRALRVRGAGPIVVAVPVGAPESIALLGGEADEVICHTIPRRLLGIGRWYEDFAPVEDDEVIGLLDAASVPPAPAEAPAPAVEHAPARERERTLQIDVAGATLAGDLTLPAEQEPRGLVIFAHGSGSSRLSPRNRAVAATLNEAGFATLLFDLLTAREAPSRRLVFDVALLARRLEIVTRTAAREEPATRGLPIGYFGASTGAAAALRAAAAAGDTVRAVVSRGGRPDLAGDSLPYVTAPTLLIIGSRDPDVLELNRRAAERLHCPHRLLVVDGATHLFEEPGTLEAVAQLATEWFAEHLPASVPRLARTGR